MVEGGNHGMKRRNIILLISIPLGIMLIVYYGYTALDTWIQFQIITGNGILLANSFHSKHISFHIEMVWTDLINHMYIRNSKIVKKE